MSLYNPDKNFWHKTGGSCILSSMPFDKGHTPWNKGKSWSQETKDKISDSKKGQRVSIATEFKKGTIPWNKTEDVFRKCENCGEDIKTTLARIKIGAGRFCSRSCASKGRFNPQYGNTMDKHHNWKGEDTKYTGIHEWIRRNWDKEKFCESCGSGGNLHWSSKDHKYSRDRNDWQVLCAKCHKDYDRGMREPI